jgi:hypothetical protein
MSYAERRNTLSKKQIASMSKWAAARPKADEATISARQRNLWDALNQYVTERGAAIVSVKYANPLRIEVATDSELPARLRELGYDPTFCEQVTRIGAASVRHDRRGRPQMTSGYGFSVRDVYLLKLPK